ncbi:MAG TPA: 3' terminal RNA ribose 2'-O-methyltransferase Hen1 [Mycobacteriales bacterium]|nr:3' terminal RNA ribose 2'-O-methyltransferase Hen1 [Mycobacteriales bacterium]
MLITLSTTHQPATDLGFLLHKHPDRVQSIELPAGTAHVAYPEAGFDRCTVALLLEVDPIGLVRGGSTLAEYVNDRPYAACSLLAVALGRAFRTAMTGRCDARPELAATALPLRVQVPALPAGSPELVGRLFEPLGWSVQAAPVPLDPAFPEWGDSRYVDLRLSGTLRLADALRHLYVLLPALDGSKHYWVGADEVDKLLRVGEGWLAGHPERAVIARRYLAHQSGLARAALARIADSDDLDPDQLDDAVPAEPADESTELVEPAGSAGSAEAAGSAETAEPVAAAEPVEQAPLRELRRAAVLAALREAGAARVLDLGCGDGVLLRALLADRAFREVVGVDVSDRALRQAERRLRLDRMPDAMRERLRLIQSSLTYTDKRLTGYDAAVLMEVIEHVDPPRLASLERAVFGSARPATVVVTTPNAEYNIRYEGLAAGAMRHPDHRFEWGRAEFAGWADRVAAGYGYAVQVRPVGPVDAAVGAATQLALFSRERT